MKRKRFVTRSGKTVEFEVRDDVAPDRAENQQEQESAGTGTVTGSTTGDTAAPARRRGRPRGAGRRAAGPAAATAGAAETPSPGVETGIPGAVAWSAISPGEAERLAPTATQKLLAAVADAVYRLPQAFGLGDHWPLSETESKQLAIALDQCLRSLPRRRKAQLVEALARYIPWFTFAVTAYVITAPRIMTTQLAWRRYAASERGPARGAEPVGPRGAAPDGPVGGIPTWEDFGR